MGKKITLRNGELSVNMKDGSLSVTVDALETLKQIGTAYGLYHNYEDARNYRVVHQEEPSPALLLQENISYHGSPSWRSIQTITDDPEMVKQCLAFGEIIKTVKQINHEMEWAQIRQRGPSLTGKKKNNQER